MGNYLLDMLRANTPNTIFDELDQLFLRCTGELCAVALWGEKRITQHRQVANKRRMKHTFRPQITKIH
jgi:hypothetical protein